jgi:hypothetical protein
LDELKARNRGERDALVLSIGERREGDPVYYPEDREYEAYASKQHPERWWEAMSRRARGERA